MRHSPIDVKTEINALFLALKLAYAIGMENDYKVFRSFAKILREYEYRR